MKLGSTIISVSEKVLEQVGLMEILSLINSENPSASNPMSSIIGLEQSTVSRKVAQFYGSLNSPPIPSFEEIDSAQIRSRLSNGIREVRMREERGAKRRIVDADATCITTLLAVVALILAA